VIWNCCRVSFELEPGATGQTTDFREANKKLEWSLKKVIFLIIFSSVLIQVINIFLEIKVTDKCGETD
jgi:hypothetical protein